MHLVICPLSGLCASAGKQQRATEHNNKHQTNEEQRKKTNKRWNGRNFKRYPRVKTLQAGRQKTQILSSPMIFCPTVSTVAILAQGTSIGPMRSRRPFYICLLVPFYNRHHHRHSFSGRTSDPAGLRQTSAPAGSGKLLIHLV